MEQTENITRSALYEEIYKIVRQIPIKSVEGDAMDAPSASYLIEQLFKKWQQHGVMQAEGSDGARGAAVGNSAAGQSGSGGMYCVSSDALVYGKPCKEWCGDENCWRGGSAKGALPR